MKLVRCPQLRLQLGRRWFRWRKVLAWLSRWDLNLPFFLMYYSQGVGSVFLLVQSGSLISEVGFEAESAWAWSWTWQKGTIGMVFTSFLCNRANNLPLVLQSLSAFAGGAERLGSFFWGEGVGDGCYCVVRKVDWCFALGTHRCEWYSYFRTFQDI